MKSWQDLIKKEKEKEYFKNIEKQILKDSLSNKIYPPQELIFNAFNLTPIDEVKVVIIGQDPYHGYGQANGLSFSVSKNMPVPPSLKNIYKELKEDIQDFIIPNHGDLTSWAKQGVLLLNNSLTVIHQKANSHSKIGWELFTDQVVEIINQEKENVIFILWGSNAHKKGKNINLDKHYIIKGVHPSPLSSYRGFFGSKPFSKANNILKMNNIKEIDWKINNI